MIIDYLKNSEQYESLHPLFKKAFDFMRDFIENDKPAGKYEIMGDELFALVQTYNTSPVSECRFEAHKRYIDIQFVVKGKEIMGVAPVEELTATAPFSDENDIVFFNEKNGCDIKMTEGMYIILYPWEAHMPRCILDEETFTKKIVMKIKI